MKKEIYKDEEMNIYTIDDSILVKQLFEMIEEQKAEFLIRIFVRSNGFAVSPMLSEKNYKLKNEKMNKVMQKLCVKINEFIKHEMDGTTEIWNN